LAHVGPAFSASFRRSDAISSRGVVVSSSIVGRGNHRICVAAVLGIALTFAGNRSASAQPTSPPAAPPAAPAAADAPPLPSSDGNTPAKEEARLHFKAGVILLQDPEKPRYEEALTEFTRAYELVRSPTILGNIGLCAMKLERDAEAIDAYSRYLAEVNDLAPSERAQTERDLVTLRAGLARVTLESHPSGALIRDTRFPSRGETVTNSYGPLQGRVELGLRRGHHVFKARYPDGVESTWEIDVNGDDAHVFERPAETPVPSTPTAIDGSADTMPTRPIPRSVAIGGIATGVFAVGTIVTGILAVSTHSRYESANDGTSASRASDLRTSGQTLNVVSDVFLGVTILGAAATAYLYFTRPTVPGGKSPGRTGIVVLPGGVAGRF
jgi:hypothetical protein